MEKSPSFLYSVAIDFSVISFGGFWLTTHSKRIIHFHRAKLNHYVKKTFTLKRNPVRHFVTLS